MSLCDCACHEGVGTEQQYSSTHSLTSALDGGSGQLYTPAALPLCQEPRYSVHVPHSRSERSGDKEFMLLCREPNPGPSNP